MGARTAIVTGAGGFIGAALGHRLVTDGFAPTLLVGPDTDCWRLEQLRDDAAIVHVDLRDGDAVNAAVAAARPELVFHLAAHGAYSWQQSLPRMVETNVLGTTHVVEAAIAAGARAIVNAGSSSEYGWKDHAPAESELPEPNSAYSLTKTSATLYCGWIARSQQQAVTTLRLYSAYGPWEEPRRLMPALVLAGIEGRLPPLVDPNVARDFVYVDDILDAFLLAAQRARPGEGAVYNVGSGVQTSLRELVDIARDVFAIQQQPQWGAFPQRGWDTDVWVADPRRAREELGWAASRSLEEGLAAMAHWVGSDPELTARYRGKVNGATAA